MEFLALENMSGTIIISVKGNAFENIKISDRNKSLYDLQLHLKENMTACVLSFMIDN